MVRLACALRVGASIGLWLGLAIGVASLAGCMDVVLNDAPPAAPAPVALARREGVSPRAASVVLASLSGAPQAVSDAFRTQFTTQAGNQDIDIADAKKARYLARGYFNAYPSEKGTVVAIVWDVFDAEKRRAQRIDNRVEVSRQAADAWSVVDETALADVAARSAEDLAAFLTNTPEALASLDGVVGRNIKTVAAAAPRNQTAVAGTVPSPAARPGTPGLGIAALQ